LPGFAGLFFRLQSAIRDLNFTHEPLKNAGLLDTPYFLARIGEKSRSKRFYPQMVRGIEQLYDPDKKKAAVLNPAQFKDLLRYVKTRNKGVRDTALVWMSFGCGMRASEMAKLKIKDVLLPNGGLIEEIRLKAEYTKTGKARNAYMVEDDHKKALVDYLVERVHKRQWMGKTDDYLMLEPESPLFLSKGARGFSFKRREYEAVDGEKRVYLNCDAVQQLLSSFYPKIGVKGGTSHSGRRTLATRLADRGVDLSIIQYILGHEVTAQTIDYIESNPKRSRRILSQVFGEF
jgi:integrase